MEEFTPAQLELVNRRPFQGPCDLSTGDILALAYYAQNAFVLGVADAYGYRPLRDSHDVMTNLFPHGWDGYVIHRKKLRQVYGAGHDIGTAQLRKERSHNPLDLNRGRV